MEPEINEGMSKFEKQRKMMMKKIEGLKSDSKVVKSVKKEKDREDDDDARINVMTAEKLFHESMDMYREGDMEWKETIDDLISVLEEIK